MKRGCRGGKGRGRKKKPSSGSETSALDGTKRSQTLAEGRNWTCELRKYNREKSKHRQIKDKMGAGSNTSKEVASLGDTVTP